MLKHTEMKFIGGVFLGFWGIVVGLTFSNVLLAVSTATFILSLAIIAVGILKTHWINKDSLDIAMWLSVLCFVLSIFFAPIFWFGVMGLVGRRIIEEDFIEQKISIK